MTTTNENVRLWSVTATSNASSDAAISSSDSQSPDTVDNNIRSIMAAKKRESDDTGGWIVATGTATALIVATASGITTAMLTNGLRLCVRTASASTGAATIAVDAATVTDIKKNNGSAIVAGDWTSGAILDLVYSSTATAFIAVNIEPKSGTVLLTSGTVAAATLDIVLTGYTAYRGLKFVLSGFLPATDGAQLQMRFSSDGGGTYIATGYNYACMNLLDSSGTFIGRVAGSTTNLAIMGEAALGNAANEGANVEVTLLNQSATAFWPRITYSGYGITSTATPEGAFSTGGGANETAQDVDGVRFLFSAGDIAAGNYAVYGLS